MTFIHAINPLYSFSGFCVGMLVGLTGVGGGSLMTPILILLFKVHPATAVGTDLLFAAASKSVGTIVHGVNRSVDWRIVGRLAIGSVIGTALTLFVLSRFNLQTEGFDSFISTVLGIMLFLTALTLLFRRRLMEFYAARVGTVNEERTAILTVLTGAVLGILVSLSSVGAGAIGVTALILLYPRLPTLRIVGSDIAHAVPLTLAAGLGHWLLGGVNWALFASLLVGSFPGIILGSYLSAKVPDKVLRPILAATLALVGAKLAF